MLLQTTPDSVAHMHLRNSLAFDRQLHAAFTASAASAASAAFTSKLITPFALENKLQFFVEGKVCLVFHANAQSHTFSSALSI